MFRLGELDPQRPAARDEKPMRNLDQEARAIAGVVFTATRATMVEIVEGRQAVPH